MLNDSNCLSQGQQFNKKQNQQKIIEGFDTTIMEKNDARVAQNVLNNASETNKRNKLQGQFDILAKQYTTANTNLVAKTNKIITRTSSLNPYLNKNITLGTDALPISDAGIFGGYVTGKGVFKSYSNQNIKDNTAGKNGCPALFTQNVTKNKFSDSLIQGSNMQSGQACGYEGQNVYVSSLNSNPTTTYVGCYKDTDPKYPVNFEAMTYDSDAIGITDFNTCKQYASDNGYSYFGMQNLQSSNLQSSNLQSSNLQSSSLAQCVVSNSIDAIKGNGDASKIISLKPLWSSKTNSSVSNLMKLNDMGQLEVFNTITENIVFSTKNIVPECVNSGKIEVTSASYDINCNNKLISGFTNLFSTIEGFISPSKSAAPKPIVSTVATAAPAAPAAGFSGFNSKPSAVPVSNVSSAAFPNNAEIALKAAIAKAAADKAAVDRAAADKAEAEKASADRAAAAKAATATAGRSISLASIMNATKAASAAAAAAVAAAAAKTAADRAAADKAAAAAAVAAKAAADKAAADKAAADKAAADRAAADKVAAVAATAAKAAADRAAAAAAVAAKAEAERKARASEATQKVTKECNNKNNCSISANTLFNTDKACNFNVAYKCGNRPFTNSTPLSGSQTMIFDCDNYITNNCTFYLLLEDNGSINIYRGKQPPESGALGSPVYNIFTNTSQLIPNPEWITPQGKGMGNYIPMNKPLTPGQWLTSKNGTVKLIMQTDGNLVLYTSEITNGCPEKNGKNYGIKNINAVYKINENNENNENINKSNLGKVAYIDADANLRDYPETMLQKSNNYTTYDKYDSIGNDITNGTISAKNVNDCKDACNKNNECAGFVYKPNEKNCYLKNVKMYPAGDRQRHENSKFVMGVRNPEIIPNVVKTCDKTIVPIDSVRYNAYKKGTKMDETVDCGIRQELTQEQSIFDTVKTSLSNLEDKILKNSNKLYNDYTNKNQKIIPAKTVDGILTTNDTLINQAQIDLIKVNDYKVKEGFEPLNINDVDSMLSDSDITILQSNYSYIMWSVLAVGLLSVTVNTVSYS